jgi:hypothetical protein
MHLSTRGDVQECTDDEGATWHDELLPKVVAGAGSLDPATIKAWLDKQTAFETGGATAPIDFTATPLPQLPRLKNLSSTQAVIQGGKVVVTNPTPVVARLPRPIPIRWVSSSVVT